MRVLPLALAAWLWLLWPGASATAQTTPDGVAHSAVIVIGGAGSYLGGTEWVPLETLLHGPQFGYGKDDVLAYSYHVDPDPGLQSAYSMAETCQPLRTSEQHLADFLTTLQQRHLFDSVTLVGHSQGGVIAMDVLSGWTDLSTAGDPFIRSVIAVDSPLMGLGWTRAFVWESLGSGGPCPSVRELAARHDQPRVIQDYYARNVGAAIERGVEVQVVVNIADLYLTPSNQSLAGLPVVTQVNVEGPVNNHAAALFDPATLIRLVSFITPQGQTPTATPSA